MLSFRRQRLPSEHHEVPKPRADAGLVPLTPEARAALGGIDRIDLARFPFRIGRRPRAVAIDDGDPTPPPSLERNDLYLDDRGRLLRVSRSHLVIHRGADGWFEVEDRESTCGTTVGSIYLHREGEICRCPIRSGERLVFGRENSPYAYRFDVADPLA